jgi:hypothetical protein
MIWTGALLLPLVVALALFSSDEDKESKTPSSYSARNYGAKAAYLLLNEEGYSVERWERPPDELPSDASNTVLLLAGPVRPPSKEEKNALHAYLNHGGRIVGTGYSSAVYLPLSNVIAQPLPDAVWKEYQPAMPSALTSAGTVAMSPEARWGDITDKELVHYADDGKGIVVSYKVGSGEVIWWAADTPLTNAGIQRAGNLALLLNSLGGSKDIHIFWDEYFHSYSHTAKTFGSYFAQPPVLSWMAQLGLAFLALLLTYTLRNGPIRAAGEPSRLSPLEFVNTLGALYQRASATRTALEAHYLRFRSLLARRLGLRISSSPADLVRGAHHHLGYSDPGLEETMNQIEASLHDLDLKEQQALALSQKLSFHAHQLKLISSEEQENP